MRLLKLLLTLTLIPLPFACASDDDNEGPEIQVRISSATEQDHTLADTNVGHAIRAARLNALDALLADSFVVVAHRGDINPVDGYPENTLESCLLAASRGARVIEVDVQRSSDGTWYLMHDDTVNRTTNGAGALGSLSDAAINALIINGGLGYDAGRHRTALKVPTLASVLEAMEPFGVLVWLDNKVAADADDLVEFLIATGWHRKALLLLHSQDAVSAVRAIDPAIPVARLDNYLNPTDHLTMDMDIFVPAWHDAEDFNVASLAPIVLADYVHQDNYGYNEHLIVQTVWNAGVRLHISNDLPAALLAQRKLTTPEPARSAPLMNSDIGSLELISTHGDVAMEEILR